MLINICIECLEELFEIQISLNKVNVVFLIHSSVLFENLLPLCIIDLFLTLWNFTYSFPMHLLVISREMLLNMKEKCVYFVISF